MTNKARLPPPPPTPGCLIPPRPAPPRPAPPCHALPAPTRPALPRPALPHASSCCCCCCLTVAFSAAARSAARACSSCSARSARPESSASRRAASSCRLRAWQQERGGIWVQGGRRWVQGVRGLGSCGRVPGLGSWGGAVGLGPEDLGSGVWGPWVGRYGQEQVRWVELGVRQEEEGKGGQDKGVRRGKRRENEGLGVGCLHAVQRRHTLAKAERATATGALRQRKHVRTSRRRQSKATGTNTRETRVIAGSARHCRTLAHPPPRSDSASPPCRPSPAAAAPAAS